MQDSHGRRIHYLRISVTDRCNLHCRYCMPAGDVVLVRHEDLLSYEEIVGVARTAVRLGFDKVRLTGGEPLIRRDVVSLVAMLAEIEGISDLAMTTNGTLLVRFAVALARAGLQRLNISLDTLDPVRYREFTGGGKVADVRAGISAAQAAGFRRIKLNCVVEESSAEEDARQVAAFAAEHGLEARFIRRMNLAAGQFWVVEGGSGGDCRICNRLRLTSEGLVRPCLFSDLGFSVRELGAEEALRRAIAAKPESGQRCLNGSFSRIGG